MDKLVFGRVFQFSLNLVPPDICPLSLTIQNQGLSLDGDYVGLAFFHDRRIHYHCQSSLPLNYQHRTAAIGDQSWDTGLKPMTMISINLQAMQDKQMLYTTIETRYLAWITLMLISHLSTAGMDLQLVVQKQTDSTSPSKAKAFNSYDWLIIISIYRSTYSYIAGVELECERKLLQQSVCCSKHEMLHFI